MGSARFGTIAVLGTAGIYGGLYGFAADERVAIVLGIALAVLAGAGWLAGLVRSSWWWQRRRPPEVAAGDEFDFDPPTFTEEELFALSYPGQRRLLPLEDEPSNLTMRYLLPTERFRGEWRRHWMRPVNRYLATFALAVAGVLVVDRYAPAGYLAASRAAVPVLGALIGLHVLCAWWVGRFMLTHKRVLLVGGVLRRRVSMAPLHRLTDLRFEQSTIGRLAGYGDFVLEGMSFFSRIRRISTLPHPNEVYLRVVEEMYDPSAVEARLGRDGDPKEEYEHDEGAGYGSMGA